MIRMHGPITTTNPTTTRSPSENPLGLEAFLLWQVYVGALNAQRRREHQKLAKSRQWQQDLRALQTHLGALGLVL